MSEGKNQPNRIESWILQDDEKPQLLLDPSVLFAGYKVPHPLENKIELRIQCDERSNPPEALKRACNLLISQAHSVKQQFMEQARNIEMGMGPDAALGVGAGMGMAGGLGAGAGAGVGVGAPVGGGYDPYGDGLGGQATQSGDVYDF